MDSSSIGSVVVVVGGGGGGGGSGGGGNGGNDGGGGRGGLSATHSTVRPKPKALPPGAHAALPRLLVGISDMSRCLFALLSQPGWCEC